MDGEDRVVVGGEARGGGDEDGDDPGQKRRRPPGDQCRPLWDSRLAARTYPAPRAMSTATATRLNQSVCHPVIRVWSWTGGEMASANNIGPSLSGQQPGSQPGWTGYQAGSGRLGSLGRPGEPWGGPEVSGTPGGRSRGRSGGQRDARREVRRSAGSDHADPSRLGGGTKLVVVDDHGVSIDPESSGQMNGVGGPQSPGQEGRS